MIIFNQLYGRLGNNIIQLSNIIDIALEYKHNIKINVKKLQFFDLSIIKDYFSKYNNSEIITDEYNFFYKNKLPFSHETFINHIDERNKLLNKAFLLKDIPKLDENDLVIHIRSGDVFLARPHPDYVPPPLSYYTGEIDRYNYRKIHIVCEDDKNPVVNRLLGLYKNAIYEKNNLDIDIKKILGATNILYSIGTFIPSLMLFSKNINFIHDTFNSIEYDKIMRPWKNTPEQRDYILKFDYKYIK